VRIARFHAGSTSSPSQTIRDPAGRWVAHERQPASASAAESANPQESLAMAVVFTLAM